MKARNERPRHLDTADLTFRSLTIKIQVMTGFDLKAQMDFRTR